MIYSALLALKLGLFLPSPDAPFRTWFYLGTDLIPYTETWNIEGGFTMDMIEVPVKGLTVNGQPGTNIHFTPTYILNAVKVINEECDLGIGARYRTYDRTWSPQLTLSFKFNSLKGDDYPYNSPYKGINNKPDN